MSLEVQLRSATTAFQNSQFELSKLVDSRQKLEAQLTENLAVKAEFDQLPAAPADGPAEAIIYKLVGNMLIKQDTDESRTNVNRRIEFLKNEQSKIEKKIEEIQGNLEKQKLQIVQLQSQVQQESATQKLSNTHISVPSAITSQ